MIVANLAAQPEQFQVALFLHWIDLENTTRRQRRRGWRDLVRKRWRSLDNDVVAAIFRTAKTIFHLLFFLSE